MVLCIEEMNVFTNYFKVKIYVTLKYSTISAMQIDGSWNIDIANRSVA